MITYSFESPEVRRTVVHHEKRLRSIKSSFLVLLKIGVAKDLYCSPSPATDVLPFTQK